MRPLCQSRCSYRAIKRRKPGGCGRTFVMILAPGQCCHQRYGRVQARQKMHPPTDATVRVLRCAAGRVHELYRESCVKEVACRKIHDAHVRTRSILTEDVLKRIGDLYAIEVEIRDAPAEERLAKRQLKTKAHHQSMES